MGMTAPLTAEEIERVRKWWIDGEERGLPDRTHREFRFGIDVQPYLGRLLDEVERARADLEMQRTAIADLQGACDAWEKRAKEAEPIMERSRALLKRIEWAGNFNGGDGDESNEACPDCGSVKERHPFAPGGESGGRHDDGCELDALIGAR